MGLPVSLASVFPAAHDSSCCPHLPSEALLIVWDLDCLQLWALCMLHLPFPHPSLYEDHGPGGVADTQASGRLYPKAPVRNLEGCLEVKRPGVHGGVEPAWCLAFSSSSGEGVAAEIHGAGLESCLCPVWLSGHG